jgi:hypothetical protein
MPSTGSLVQDAKLGMRQSGADPGGPQLVELQERLTDLRKVSAMQLLRPAFQTAESSIKPVSMQFNGFIEYWPLKSQDQAFVLPAMERSLGFQ